MPVLSVRWLNMTKERNLKTLCSLRGDVRPGCTELVVDTQKKRLKRYKIHINRMYSTTPLE